MPSRRHQNSGINVRYLLLHPAVWFVAATSTLLFLGVAAWDRHRDQFLDTDAFRLTDSSLKINDAPEWATALLQDTKLALLSGEASLLDPELVASTANQLEATPWIRAVETIEKSPQALDIRLRYRHAVALFEEIGGPVNRSICFDGDGVCFDEQVLDPIAAAKMKADLLRINMPFLDLTDTLGWHETADARIQPAARLAEWLVPHKDPLKIYRLVTRSTDVDGNGTAKPQFELWTKNATTVIWGSAPGDERHGEASPAKKIEAIHRFVAEFGELEQFSGSGSHAIDVTAGEAVVIKYQRLAAENRWLHSLK